MGRINKTTEGVFVNIVGTIDRHPMYEQFLSQKIQDPQSQSSLARFLEMYRSKCVDMKIEFERLSELETIIMQLNTRMNFKDTVKLYFIKKKSGTTYIYARCPFFRRDTEINEIRILIDKANLYMNHPDEEGLSIMTGNIEFMSMVYDRLEKIMDEEIEQNVKNYFEIYKK